ncbi:PhzF family phenazine biosynthesis protein [Novosphingobium sp. KCTC 2891]|uniref:PhzF family phenazine biosynthesis protein n=1 Tax=Novosphingobium sp. KCTC 2891 TaxID=2989730 RepID=UPI002221F286|nr:PhzF family phenazine biosynthesis protein [Novosphingobium sp. KCTC 2891]MCW1382339.1 PhzF family phenazine biosynthesis protein [Novosphingobium sp. KCTC 2891]
MSAPAARFFLVDAFGRGPLTGNQAAVLLLDAWPDDETLRRIAAELMVAETAFLVPDRSGAADWQLRWFTPQVEVLLCGHGTLGAAHALLQDASGAVRVRFATRWSGVLEVARDGEILVVSLPVIPVEAGPVPGQGLLGAPRETFRSAKGYNLLVYAEEAEIRALAPDFAALAALGPQQFICTAPAAAPGAAIATRVFVPGKGVPEDAATGSAHAVLARYWAQRLGQARFSAWQASPRGGWFDVELAGDRVLLGGRCTTVVEGTFRLP